MRIAHALAIVDEVGHERLAARGSIATARHAPWIAGVVAWLALGCRPAAPTQPEPQATRTAAAADAPTVAPVTSNERPHTCEVELAISSRMIHRTRTKGSAERARESAWDGVCTTLRHQHDIDCRDPDRVTVVSDAPRRPKDGNDESRQYHDHELVLTVLRVATGVGEAPGDRSEACHHARAHACEQLVGGPCPETGMHVISVDGKPSNAAAGEPAPKASPVI